MLTIQTQLKIYHWQTKKYSEHKAFGQAYDSLDELIDSFMEIYIGKFGNNSKDQLSLSLYSYNDNFKSQIKEFIKILSVDITKILSQHDTDLLNIRDEILGTLNQLLYLLSLE